MRWESDNFAVSLGISAQCCVGADKIYSRSTSLQCFIQTLFYQHVLAVLIWASAEDGGAFYLWDYSPSADVTGSLNSGSLGEDKRRECNALASSSPIVLLFDQRQNRFNQRVQRLHAETHSLNYCWHVTRQLYNTELTARDRTESSPVQIKCTVGSSRKH